MQDEASHVDIVIPVYNALDLTRRCAQSVLRHATGSFRLLLVDDASTDPGMPALLDALSADARVRVLRNERNLGFVRTANRGMRESADGDVLLLNSDTEVFEGFLDRLRAAAHVDPGVGIVSALSNNATILSVPVWLKDNPIPAGHTPESFAALVSRVSRRERPEIVTAVGFCMYIRREVLRKVGAFDEVTFGRGFGEENDLCERAKQAGFSVRVADDVFVWHKGKASFGEEGHALERANLLALERKQPGYQAAVNRFIASNPLAPVQRRIRFGLDRETRRRTGSMLYLVHASPWAPTPGGTEYHVLDLVRALRLPRALIAYPRLGALAVAEVFDGALADAAHYVFPLRKPPDRYCVRDPAIEAIAQRWVAQFDIRAVHVQHFLDLPIALARTFADTGIPVGLTLHDYYSVCPNLNLFDSRKGKLCGFDSSGRCDVACVASLDPAPKDPAAFVVAHRAAFADAFGLASFLAFPSRRALEITGRALPLDFAKAVVVEHGHDPGHAGAPSPPGPRLRVAIAGEVAAPLKGRDAYLESMRRTRGAALEWHVFGTNRLEGFREAASAAAGKERIVFHDRYERHEIEGLLAGAGIDVAVLLPAVHETYSYVLSEVVGAGIPAIVNRMGALPERVERGGFGFVVEGPEEAGELLGRLAADRTRLAGVTGKARTAQVRSTAQMADAYRELYRERGMLPDAAPIVSAFPDAAAELAERFWGSVPTNTTHAAPSLQAPGYQGSRWYPLFRRLKFLVPRRVREVGRAALVRRERSVIASFDPRSPAEVSFLSGARLVRRGRGAIFAVEDGSARVVFAPHPFPAESARVLRFWLRHGLSVESYAQIFWNHGAGDPFDDRRSLRIELHKAPGEWKEYVIQLDPLRFERIWDPRKVVHQVRFDPISLPGEIEVGRIEFCA